MDNDIRIGNEIAFNMSLYNIFNKIYNYIGPIFCRFKLGIRALETSGHILLYMKRLCL